MKDILIASTGTLEYGGFVFQRNEMYYFKVTSSDTGQDIFTSESIYKSEEEASEALENKIDEMYI